MKQSISRTQYESLSDIAKLKWRDWCSTNEYGSVFADDEFVEMVQPTIGILIEFLSGNYSVQCDQWMDEWKAWRVGLNWNSEDEYDYLCEQKELVDALFMATQHVLEKD